MYILTHDEHIRDRGRADAAPDPGRHAGLRALGRRAGRTAAAQPAGGVQAPARAARGGTGRGAARRAAARVPRAHGPAGGDRRLAGALPPAVEPEARRARPASRRGGNMNEGTAQPLDGRSLIRFERRYPHSMERVWAALTEPEQLQQWFGEGDIELELVEGGRFDVVTTG